MSVTVMGLRPRRDTRTVTWVVGAVSAVVLAMQPAPADGQQPAADDHQLIQDLLVRIQTLESEVRTLKEAQARAGAPPSAAGQAPGQMPAESPAPLPPGAVAPAMQIRGFADMNYRRTDAHGTAGSFSMGQLDLFMSSALSENTAVVGELIVESSAANAFDADLERLLLQYKPKDYLNIAVGRYHTAIGYYNTAYHHGTWFQTATGRPFVFKFEDDGGLLPIHGVGVTVNGRIPSGRLGLQYVAEIGNGRTSRSPLAEPVQNFVDENNRKAFNVALLARPDAIPGLQAGASFYRDRLEPSGKSRISETILAGHVVYHGHGYELLNEGVAVRHVPTGGRAVTTPAFYTQVARQVVPQVTPYFRYQYFNAPDGELLFGDVGLLHGPSIGLRYDFEHFAALKIQYDRTMQRRVEATNGFAAQLAFTF